MFLAIKCLIKNAMYKHSATKELAVRISYLRNSGRFLNLKNPKTWSEKMVWLNKYWQPEIKSLGADKYLVREYLANKGLEKILLKSYGVWSNPEEIDFDALPNRFVLKCNHGCGYNIICEDKDKLNISKAKDDLNRWLKIDYGTSGEYHYHYIKPLIYCEEFLPVVDYKDVKDYKIHCFDGNPEFIGVCTDRDITTLSCIGIIYSTTWERLYYLKNDRPYDGLFVDKPKPLSEMLNIARILSEGIPYVRIDLYAVDDKVFFGEMTFTPDGNILDREYRREIVKEFGNKITLPAKIARV